MARLAGNIAVGGVLVTHCGAQPSTVPVSLPVKTTKTTSRRIYETRLVTRALMLTVVHPAERYAWQNRVAGASAKPLHGAGP